MKGIYGLPKSDLEALLALKGLFTCLFLNKDICRNSFQVELYGRILSLQGGYRMGMHK